MLKAAIDKLNQEIEADQQNAYVKYIGEYLIDYINKNPHHAENIMREGKSIAGSLDYMKSEAKKTAKNGMAMFTPEEGFKTVLDYYEIKEAPVLRVVSSQKKVDISLDDLL